MDPSLCLVQGKLSIPSPPSESFLRATGPKTVHAERSLHFLPPSEYQASKERRHVIQHSPEASEALSHSYPKGKLKVHSVEFETGKSKMVTRRRGSYTGSTVQYHSLADSIGEGHSQLPRKQKSVEVPVLSMKVLDPKNLPTVVT